SGRSGQHQKGTRRYPAAEDPVERLVPGSEAIHHDPDARASTLSTISELENGFRITRSAPIAPFGLAVSMMTGMEAVFGSAFKFSSNSRPSITGIIKSVTITSGR